MDMILLKSPNTRIPKHHSNRVVGVSRIIESLPLPSYNYGRNEIDGSADAVPDIAPPCLFRTRKGVLHP